jgi:WD40 repeat protein
MAAVKSARLKVVQQVAVRGTLFAAARVPRSARLFVGGSDFAVSEVDLSAPKPALKELGRHDSYVTGVALAGPLVVTGSYDGRLIWWDPGRRSRVRTVEAHRKWIRGVKAFPDSKLLASVADDMVCRLWDGASGKLLHELRGHQERTPHHFPSMLYACALSRDGRHVATGDKVGQGGGDVHLGPGAAAALDRGDSLPGVLG